LTHVIILFIIILMKLQGEVQLSPQIDQLLKDKTLHLPPDSIIYVLRPLEAALINYIRELGHGTITKLEVANSLPMSAKLEQGISIQKLRFMDMLGLKDQEK